MSIWSGVLDSCPGLLCCVINIKGRLIYATHGYKAIASRLFGHKCEEGRTYPPLITQLDREIHDALTAACLGQTNAIEIAERNNVWELTVAPLKLIEDGQNKISGVVVRVASSASNNHNQAPIIRSNPNILDSITFRACVADEKGIIIAANKFLSSSLGINPSGSNIAEFIDTQSISHLISIIINRSGKIECLMQDISVHDNFYDVSPEEIFFDAALNKLPEKINNEPRLMRIHASPIEWNGEKLTLLTFEDITDFTKTHEQLRRILTFDAKTGILNKRGLEHALLQKISYSHKNNEDLSLISLSIDNAKYISETSGYAAAEKMIREFAKKMKDFLDGRAESIYARYSKNEFMSAVNCPGAVAVVMANEIRYRAGDIPVSAGVADYISGAYSGVNEFIAAAYDTMNRAKSEGGNITLLAGR